MQTNVRHLGRGTDKLDHDTWGYSVTLQYVESQSLRVSGLNSNQTNDDHSVVTTPSVLLCGSMKMNRLIDSTKVKKYFQGASGNAGPRVGCCRISDPVKAPVAAALTADEFDYANGSFIQIGSIATMLLAYLFI